MHGFVWMTPKGTYLRIYEKTFPVTRTHAEITPNIDSAYVGMRLPAHVDVAGLGPLIQTPAYVVALRRVSLAASLGDAELRLVAAMKAHDAVSVDSEQQKEETNGDANG